MTQDPLPAFRPLPGVYEPSAVQQLPDGRFLVVEDEKDHPFSLLSIAPDGGIASRPLEPGLFQAFDSFWKLDDLEGLACDDRGRVYATTSHSRSGSGEEKKSRDRLVRFRIEADRVIDTHVSGSLKAALATTHPLLAKAAEVRQVKERGGLNIEALDFDQARGHLLIGLRSPLLEGRAVIARLENPDALFDNEAPPRIAANLATLDLDGQGIRGMAHLPELGGHLIISGPPDRAPEPFGLWLWSGDRARRVGVPGLPGWEHAEGITPARIGDRTGLLVVSDDGSRRDGRCARYLLLDIARLRPMP
jgi:hypothetical protein